MNKIIFFVLLFCFIIGVFVFEMFRTKGIGDQKHDADDNKDNPFGVLEFLHWNHAWNHYRYPDQDSVKKAVKLIKESGAGWVRVDFLWQDIEPVQGEFDFEKYDFFTQELTENNINILGILDYSADWASDCRKWNYPSSKHGLFVNYAVKVIGRYKDKIKYWEVWNEPDSHIYWEPQDGLKNYCLLLKEVYTAAKKEDPDCKILNGGLASGLLSVNRLYDNGAKDYFDILNLHIFDSPLDPIGIKRITAYPELAHKIMKRNGDAHKKIWVTEIGAPGVKQGTGVANWWIGDNPDEQKQAEWVSKVYTRLLALDVVEKVFWAFFRDSGGHWQNGTDYLGLVRWDFSKKPSFPAYKKCSQKRGRSPKCHPFALQPVDP